MCRFLCGIAILLDILAWPHCGWSDEVIPAKGGLDQQIVGVWLGTLEVGSQARRIVFKVSRRAEGVLVATMDSPERGRKDVPVTRLDWRSGNVELAVQSIGGEFRGSLNSDATQLVGHWHQPPHTLPLTLRKVDRAPEVPALPFATGVYLAAVITSLLACLLIGGFILLGSPRQEWRFLAAVMSVHLPLAAFAFYIIRLPVDRWLAGLLGSGSPVYAGLQTLYAPLTEEPAKLWLLLIPWFVQKLRPENAPRVALAIGLGFGIGEAWMLAGMLATDPTVARLAWYQLGGFVNERVMVCLHHGVFNAAALCLYHRAPLRGILFAMTLHFIGNFPIALAAWNVGGLGALTWSVILQIWLVLFFLAMIMLLGRFLQSADREGWGKLRRRILGQARCPECGLIYDRGFLAANLGRHRYERCPGCCKWHLTTSWKEKTS